MPRPCLLSRRQVDLVSAALRHVDDALGLLPGSPDQAWHLAGFGPECIRKACLTEPWFDKALGHDWGPASESLLEFAVAIDPGAARCDLSGWAHRAAALATWSPEHRYDRTGRHAGGAYTLVETALELTLRVHASLWADGRLESAVAQ